MSSLKMTFSLTSLILLMATFGLVLAVMPVMAHDAEQTGTPATVGPHTHPVKVEVAAVAANPNAVPPTPAILAVPIHGDHPTVTVSLKAGDTVKGTEVVVTSATPGTTDVVTLVVQFNMPVADAATTTEIAATELLELADFTIAIRNNEGTLITDVPTLGTVVRTDATTGAKATKFEVPLTMPASAIPSGTADAADEKFELIVKLNQGVVFGLRDTLESGDRQTDITVDGGASQASMVETFTLVKAFTSAPDTTAPTVMVEAGVNSPTNVGGLTNGKVPFTITFSERLDSGFGSFTIGDVSITGGSATAADLTGPADDTDDAQEDDVYTLLVTPDADDGEVMVTVGHQIADVARNEIDPTDSDNTFSASVELDSTPPVVLNHSSMVLTAPPAGASAGTYLTFTLTFSEPVQSFTVDAIDQGNSHNAGFDTRYFGPVSGGTSQMLSAVWNVTVDVPEEDSVTSIRLKIGTGAVMDEAGNGLAVAYTAANTLANTRPYFVGTMNNIGICEGDDLGSGIPLPLAADLDRPAQRLSYTISPALPMGLFVEPVDLQNRSIKGKTSVVGTTTHTWQVEDQYGLTATTPITFTITVKAHQEPEKPTGLMAMKVDSASIEDPTQNRVKLTWPQAMDKSAYPDCIPAVTSYTVSQTMKDEVTGTYPDSTLMTYSSVAGSMYAESFVKPTGSEAWSFTTPKLDIGIYKFTIVAHNGAGASDASDAAVWDKTMLMEVVVADPPAEPKQLEGAIDQDGNQVTLNWLKVPDAMDGGAPIDDLGVYKANTRYGGYVIYQVRDEDDQVTRYPATGTLEIADYEHPTWQTPNLDPGQYVFRVTAMNIAGESPRSNATREFTIVSSGTRPPVLPPVTSATYSNGVTTIGTGQMIAPNGFYVIRANALPDIHRFFAEGGTISVLGATGAEAKSVVISEIMWGRNLRQAVGAGRKAEQFIELYNTSTASISLSAVTLVFDSTNAVPAVPTGKVLLDQISNVSGIGWLITEAPGQDGSLAEPGDPTTFVSTNLISMYRNINYDNVRKTHNADDAVKNRTEQLKAVPDGNNLGNWKASDDADTYGINRIGSPGAEHFVAYVRLTRTNVPRDQFIINEIGNYSDDKYDWVEIKRVGSADNLKKWRLSQVTDDKKDTALVTFPDNDNHKIPNQNDVLLIVNSDPYQDPDHPLAAGDRINGGHVEKTGTTSRYYVDSGLKLKNSGKTLLILRNSNDNGHLGKSNNIQDVVGTLGITDNSAGFRTNLWPLVATDAPHGDVITDGPPEELKSGSVYVRNDAGGGTGEHDLSTVGYTGVGYKRSAAKSGLHGGTPGYDNGAIKVNEADLASDATVSISEIMYTKGRNLPQWIELYNSSMTQAVNLGEWKLRIEHSRDVEDVDIRYPSVTTNNLGGVIIPPNQTVLLVSSTTGRTSRAAQGNVDFPASRIIDLWGQKDRLEVPSTETRRTYKLLSETAFKITLLDKSNAAVDIAGNLGADGTAMWELPSNDTEGRSSIIRRYNEGSTTRGGAGEAVDGTMSVWNGGGADGMKGDSGWVYAAASDLGEVRANETYYGSPDDVGTPGYRGGGPLPVSLSKFRPERLESGEIVVRWTTESELNNAGFNILRSETRDGQFTKVNTSLIAGQGTTSERTAYEWKDTSAKPNVVYYYQIQDVSLDGQVQTLRQSRLKGDISAAGKLTTTWGELKALQ